MPGAVHAAINYILPTDEKPVTYLTNPGSRPAQPQNTRGAPR